MLIKDFFSVTRAVLQRVVVVRGALGLALLSASWICYAAAVDDVQRLLDSGDAAAAYAAALTLSEENSGEPDFDFVFGLAALDSGHTGEAVLALERVVLLRPDDLRARLEVARAYYAAGEWENARAQFDFVLQKQPPANVQTRIGEYVQAIDTQLQSLVWRTDASVALETGYDNNVNSATPDSSIEVPALGTVQLADASRANASPFVSVTSSGKVQYQLSKRAGLSAGANAQWRNNTHSDTYDTLAGGVQAGPVFSGANHRFSLPVQYQQMAVNDQTWRRMWGAALEYAHAAANRQMGVTGQVGRLAYLDDPARDADVAVLGVNFAYQMRASLTLAISLFYGEEQLRVETTPHYGRNYGGTRLALQRAITAHWVVASHAGWQRIRYAAEEPVFAETRMENLYSANLALRRQVGDSTTLQLGVDWSHNDANLPLYEYDRTQVSGVIAREF